MSDPLVCKDITTDLLVEHLRKHAQVFPYWVAADKLREKDARIAELEAENAQFREAFAKGFEEFAPDTTWRSCDLAYMIRNFDVWNIERNRRAARAAYLGEKK